MAAFKKVALLLFVSICTGDAEQARGNPLGKVFDLMNALEAKIVKEGEAEAKAFEEFYQWCDKASQNLNNEIKISTKSQEKLQAKIVELESDIEISDSKIEELSGAIATNEAELKDATTVRSKEASVFAATEKELMGSLDTLDRAITIIKAEMAKSGSAVLAQIDTSSMSALLQSIGTVVEAAGLESSDRKKLLAFVQSRQEDGDEEMGAPATSAYASQSGGIVDVLEELKDKAETELAEARKVESNSKHNFDMMKQSLDNQIAADTEDLNGMKAFKAGAAEEKGQAEGDLAIAATDSKGDKESLDTSNQDCMTAAANHEASTAARSDELKVIANAKKILKESTTGAAEKTYSFLQTSSSSRLTMQMRENLAGKEVVALVKKLARSTHSAALTQLASRISVVMKYADRADPFGKIKDLISAMISKLQEQAQSEATEKDYCDKELATTEAKKAELDHDIAKVTTKIDKAAARSAGLKEEIRQLQAELALLAKTLAELTRVRQEEHSNYVEAKSDLEQGLSGVREALGLLRDYYGGGASMIQDDAHFGAFMQQPAKPQQHAKAGGAGGSIINILEVCESDFATNLAKEESEESDAEADFQKISQAKKVSQETKESDVKYKSREVTSLAKTISELSSDLDNSNSEHAAVLEYYGRVKERCVAKPQTYEQRKDRREEEISGLKEALSIIESEAAFVQRKKRMRGSASVLQ